MIEKHRDEVLPTIDDVEKLVRYGLTQIHNSYHAATVNQHIESRVEGIPDREKYLTTEQKKLRFEYRVWEELLNLVLKAKRGE